jgi:hypothetical protein
MRREGQSSTAAVVREIDGSLEPVMKRIIARFALLGLASLITIASPAAQGTSDPWYGLQANAKNVDQPRVFTGAFQIALPKNWHLAPGHTGTIFSIVEDTRKWETGGLITLEYMRLQAPLEPALIAAFGERELKEVQSRELSGKQFNVAVKNGQLGPIILLQYDRPGISGTDDHVAQYSIPIGLVMYRLVCIAPTASVEKYRPMFAHVAASFQPAKAGS